MKSRNSSNKKAAIYGGLFGLGIGWGIGNLKSNYLNMVGHPHRGLITEHAVVGLVAGATAGCLIRRGIGFFGTRKNQPICQPKILPNKNMDPERTKQASFKN